MKPQEPPDPVSLQKVGKTATVCYHFDATAPMHCFDAGLQCDVNSNPLILERRISKTPNITVHWQDWVDPSLQTTKQYTSLVWFHIQSLSTRSFLQVVLL